MIRQALDFLVTRSLQDQIFLVLLVGIAILVVASVFFALVTVFLRYKNEQTAERWNRLEESWEPVLMDVLSGDAPTEALWERVGDADRMYFVDFLLRYAHRLRGEELASIRDLARPFLGLVVERTRDPNPERRAWAVQTLVIMGLEEYRETLIEALDDESPVVAMVAARSLAEGGGLESTRQILDRMDRYRLWSRSFLAEMLASMGPDHRAELESAYLEEDNHPDVRAVCAEALTQISDPDAAELAVRVLESMDLDVVAADGEGSGEVTKFGDEREVAITSLRLLEEVGHPGHLEPVRRLISSRDPVLRSLAVRVLGKAGDPEEDAERVRSALTDPSPWVALNAARALRSLGLNEELEGLAESDSERAELAREVLSP